MFDRLWPLDRSLTGEGVRKTHDVLAEYLPLERIEVPAGTQAFDWAVPPEWVQREAYVIDPGGRRILDVAENNLHLVGYSAPYRGELSRAALDEHLHSLPDVPDAIPYVTSYYHKTWGFCLSQRQRDALSDGNYQVVVDTAFDNNGSMTLSEAVLPGESSDEILISTYTCHPSMANNELSGPLAATFLYRRLAALPKRRLTYRFVFLAETIGALAYLAERGEHLKQHLVGGLIATCVGMDAPPLYKRSITGNTVIDRATEEVLRGRGSDHKVVNFYPWGSDERQYCSPGFELPVGCLMRGNFFECPEYHTSLDNKDFISFSALSETISIYEEVCLALECNVTYRNLVACGEPQLSKHGLYPKVGARRQLEQDRQDLMWLLCLANGKRDLIDIARRSGCSIAGLDIAAQKCREAGILEKLGGSE